MKHTPHTHERPAGICWAGDEPGSEIIVHPTANGGEKGGKA